MNSQVVCGNATSHLGSEKLVTWLVSGVSINHRPITQVSMRPSLHLFPFFAFVAGKLGVQDYAVVYPPNGKAK